MRKFLLYSFVGIASYLMMQKFFPEKPKPVLDLRGGDPFASARARTLKYLLKDRSFRAAIVATFATVIGTEFHQQIIDALIKCSPTIIACPKDKIRLTSKVRKILRATQYTQFEEIKEILLNDAITTSDKLELLIIKVKAVLRNLRGIKRNYFILTLLSLLIFLYGNNTVAFTTFWSSLRELFGATPLSDDVDEYLIDLYREYNAPLPEDLVRNITNIS